MSIDQSSAKQIAERAKRRAENAAAGRSPDVITAQSSAGEMVQELFPAGSLPGVTGTPAEILSPGEVFRRGWKSFLTGIAALVKNPRALIFTIVISVLWFFLGVPIAGQGAGGGTGLNFLSWLTFAGGGLNRSIPGMLGGMLGKGTVAAALYSLTEKNGISAVLKGAGSLLSSLKQKGSLRRILPGAFAAVLLYFVFTGKHFASSGMSMAGIAGLILSLRALGGGKGFLYRMIQSVTARVENGVRTAVPAETSAMLAGLAAGFAGITAVTTLL